VPRVDRSAASGAFTFTGLVQSGFRLAWERLGRGFVVEVSEDSRACLCLGNAERSASCRTSPSAASDRVLRPETRSGTSASPMMNADVDAHHPTSIVAAQIGRRQTESWAGQPVSAQGTSRTNMILGQGACAGASDVSRSASPASNLRPPRADKECRVFVRCCRPGWRLRWAGVSMKASRRRFEGP
jgi:hypothetical protein